MLFMPNLVYFDLRYDTLSKTFWLLQELAQHVSLVITLKTMCAAVILN